MIDWQKSAEKNNSDADALQWWCEKHPSSSKKVWAICDICGFGRWVEYQQYSPKCNKSHGDLEITQELVRELFTYNGGDLFWRNDHTYRNKAGDIAGFLRNDGYRQIKIFSKPYLTHRLIFLYHHGYLPEYLDHIDRDRSNNKIGNLREVTGSQNRMNSEPRMGNNGSEKSSKYTGVSWRKDTHRWISYINGTKTRIYIGAFIDEEDAALAYNEKAKELHGEYACLNEVD